MSVDNLTFYSSWASIISFLISLISFVYIRSIKANIVRFRRKQRLRSIIDDVLKIPDDATPLSKTSITKLASLKRNVPTNILSYFTARGRHAIEIHKYIASENIAELKELINDWTSFSEEI